MGEDDGKGGATPTARLILLGSATEPSSWPVVEGTLVIGRSKDCQVSVPDTRLSRHHTQPICQGRQVLVSDLGSVNGTYLQGSRIHEPQQLRDGDVLRVGPLEFRFEVLAPPEAETPERATIVMQEPSSLPRLEVASESQRGHIFELTKDRMVVGRAGQGHSWDIVLTDRGVSRPHAEIARRADGFLLRDLGSANGTLVNGAALSGQHTLSDGDAITFGEAVLVFRGGSA